MNRFLSRLLFVFAVVSAFASVRAEERVLIIGDSMMRIPAHATKLELKKRGGVEAMDHTSLGSGLARLDAYDWMGKIDQLVAEFNPTVTMVWFGTNDRQPMRTPAGVVEIGQDAWAAEYARRVGEAMDKLLAPEGAKVYWFEIPVMRDEDVMKDVKIINAIARAEAEKRDRVEFFETDPLLTRKPGTYAPYLIGPTGRPIKVREQDGIHLSRPGADIVAEAFVKEVFQ